MERADGDAPKKAPRAEREARRKRLSDRPSPVMERWASWTPPIASSTGTCRWSTTTFWSGCRGRRPRAGARSWPTCQRRN
eukprot:2892424-Alexandrium_andersonii.AAC.1